MEGWGSRIWRESRWVMGEGKRLQCIERCYGWGNSYTSYSLHKYPKLFVAHGLLDPLQPDPAARLPYWVREHGFQGMRFSPIYHPNSTWLNSKEHYPLWREAEKLGAVFNFSRTRCRCSKTWPSDSLASKSSSITSASPTCTQPTSGPDFRKMFRLKRFPQVWISASEPYELSLTKDFPYRDTIPFFKAVYEEFGGRQLIWGTGYPKPRWELPMDKELEFVNQVLDFYTPADRELILGKNALGIWRFPK